MSEEFESHEVNPRSTAEFPETGNPVVDGVLTNLSDLSQQPVGEHVALFERAHEQLRGVLDGPRLPRP